MTTQAKYLKSVLRAIGLKCSVTGRLKVRTEVTTGSYDGHRYREFGKAVAYVDSPTNEQYEMLLSIDFLTVFDSPDLGFSIVRR